MTLLPLQLLSPLNFMQFIINLGLYSADSTVLAEVLSYLKN